MKDIQQNTSPLWSYLAPDTKATDVKQQLLLLWESGLCLAAFDAEGGVCSATVQTVATADPFALENILMTLKTDAVRTGIFLLEPRSLLVPEELFAQETAASWLRQLHFVETDEEVFYNNVIAVKAKAIFPVKQAVSDLFKSYFLQNDIHLLNIDVLGAGDEWNTESYAYVVAVADSYLLCVVATGRVLIHQIGKYQSTTDIIYKIAAAAENFGIEQEQIKISLYGLGADLERISCEMREYFPQTNIIGNNETAYLQFLQNLN